MLYQRRRIKHRIDYRLYLYIDDIPGTRGILVMEVFRTYKGKGDNGTNIVEVRGRNKKIKKGILPETP